MFPTPLDSHQGSVRSGLEIRRSSAFACFRGKGQVLSSPVEEAGERGLSWRPAWATNQQPAWERGRDRGRRNRSGRGMSFPHRSYSITPNPNFSTEHISHGKSSSPGYSGNHRAHVFFFLVQEGRHQVLYVPWNADKNKNNFFKAIKKFKKK